MSPLYPEWIQEQLDKVATPYGQSAKPVKLSEQLLVRLAASESRVMHYIGYRFDRVEAKLDRLMKMHDKGPSQH